MSTVSVGNVHAAAQNLFQRLRALGLVPENAMMMMSKGNPSAGIAWGVSYRVPGQEGTTALPAVDLHGAMSRTTAHARLTAATYALDAVIRHQGLSLRVGPRLGASN